MRASIYNHYGLGITFAPVEKPAIVNHGTFARISAATGLVRNDEISQPL